MIDIRYLFIYSLHKEGTINRRRRKNIYDVTFRQALKKIYNGRVKDRTYAIHSFEFDNVCSKKDIFVFNEVKNEMNKVNGQQYIKLLHQAEAYRKKKKRNFKSNKRKKNFEGLRLLHLIYSMSMNIYI